MSSTMQPIINMSYLVAPALFDLAIPLSYRQIDHIMQGPAFTRIYTLYAEPMFAHVVGIYHCFVTTGISNDELAALNIQLYMGLVFAIRAIVSNSAESAA